MCARFSPPPIAAASRETRAHRFPWPFLLMMESLSRKKWQLSSAAGSAGALSSSICRPGAMSVHLREALSGPPKVTELSLPAYTPPEQQKGMCVQLAGFGKSPGK